MKFLKTLIILSLLAGVTSHSAHAYIPPFWFSIRSLAQNRKDLQSVAFKSKISSNSGLLHLANHYEIKTGITTISILDSSEKPSFTETFSFTSTPGNPHIVPALLFQEQSPLIAKSLVDFGFSIPMPHSQDPVNHEKTKLVRESGRIGYLYLGSNEKKLIIEKDQFQPISIESKGVRITFKNTKLARYVIIPRLIQVSEAATNTLIIQEEISDIQINTAHPSQKSGMNNRDEYASDLYRLALKWLK